MEHAAIDWRVCGSGEELAVSAAELALAAIRDAVAVRGVARVALSGGNTPLGAYAQLAAAAGELGRVRWFWVDERAVPPDHPRSNYAAVRRALLDPAHIPPQHVFRMTGEEPPERAAEAYAELLLRELGAEPLRFDLVVAGIGADGHTASLFPNTGAVRRSDRPVIAVHPGEGLEPRISLSRPVLVAARRTLILCTGAEKRNAVAAARTTGDEDAVPARLFLAAEPGSVTWLVDRAAAG